MIKKILAPHGDGTCSEIALTGLRVFVGLAMALAHGWGKMPPSEMLIENIAGMGFPAPEFFSWCAALAEVAGGLLLAVGLLTRPAAAFMAITMLVAGLVVHAADPFRVKELAFLYLVISLFFMVRGAGRYSLDRLLHGARSS